MFDNVFKRINTFEDFRTELVEGKEKRAGTELAQEIIKKQKVGDDKETTKIKKLMEMIPDEKEVAIDAFLSKADIAMKLITFTLSHFDKPLSFNLDVFSIVIGIERSKDFVSIPPKETVKADLVTLGLTDGNDTSLSSSDLINSSLGSHDQQMPLHPVTDKKERKSNISYTRYLSLIMEHMLGEAYINENLKTLKPHHITALSFKPILENETALTSHGCKVAKLSPDPIKSLLPPSGEVNADDSADKSSFETSMHLVIQPKAPTNLKTKKKQIPPASKPKSSKQVKDLPPKKQVDETQPIMETVATADATQSLGASESTEDQENQPRTADAEKVTVLNIRGTARNHSQTSLGESGEVKGYL
ncbi:hypothetical protein Tco_0255472 [Tanacetum coccineum]